MQVRLYRDCDSLRLRKVVIEVMYGKQVIVKGRMFGPVFKKLWVKRLAHRIKHLIALAETLKSASV